MTMLDDTGQRDAFKYLSDVLDQYGLSGLASWAWGEVQNNRPTSQVLLDMRDTAEFKVRFGTVMDARKAAGLPAMSPAEIVSYENSWNQLAKSAGLPDTFASRDTAQSLMAKNVSVAEAQARVQQGYVQMTQAPVEVRAAFDAFFGPKSDSALAAFFTDPDLSLPDLERQVSEAQIGGAATQAGFGNVDEALARRLALNGVSQAQAQQGFGQLAGEHQLFQQTVGEAQSGGGVTTEQGINAEFGLSGEDAAAVKRAAQQRQADFSGYGTAAADQSGLTGTGSARQV